LDTSELSKHIEALIFVSETPLRIDRIAEILETDRATVRPIIDALALRYATVDGGLRLEEVSEGFQLRTIPASAPYLQQLVRTRPFRFSRAALETLAIIAYRQPVTRAEVEYLRGVDSGGVVKTLLEKQLVRILGKKDVPGRPLMYGTSRDFLEFFGLRDLASLPTLKEFSELAPESLDSGLTTADDHEGSED